MTSILENETIGAVLVCGAGVTGIQASLDLAGSGFKVYLLDPTAAIGGRIAQNDNILPTGDCVSCVLSPKLVECARNRNIEIVTLADVQNISGQSGRFKVKIRQNPRYIDIKKCDACGDCADVCPVNLPNEANGGFIARKAAFQPYPQAIPNAFVISKATGQVPCTAHCPARVNVQGSIALIAAGKLTEAYDLIRQRCPIPASCGRVCKHPCESSCNREPMDEAVAFRNLERFVGDCNQANPSLYPPFSRLHSLSDETVAVIGSGPAGLTAATDLTLLGYRVTLFEAKPQLGGMLRYGIPSYRLPKDILDKEIKSIIDLGVEVKTNAPIAVPKDLLKSDAKSNGGSENGQGFHAVFVATGAWANRRLGIPGEDAQGVVNALDFLCDINTGNTPPIGPNVLVVGSSDLALDAARCALRLPGVQSVHLSCIESRAEMPAPSDEVSKAIDEGVILHNGLGPTRILARGEQVASVAFRACTSVFENYRGYRRNNPLFDDSQVSVLQADTVIVAVGRGTDLARLEIEMRPDGRILADETTLATSVKGVFAGGDVVLGPASVADAIAQGHKAAEAIDAFIRGAANIRSTDIPHVSANTPPFSSSARYAPNPRPDAPRQARVKMPQADASVRLQSMCEIELGYSREQAMSEAQRCLSCGLCSECMQCVKACSAGAIVHGQQSSELDVEVGSIIFSPGSEEMFKRLGLEMIKSGTAQTEGFFARCCSRPGIYVAGTLKEEDHITESIIRGSAAAASAMEQLTTVRGTMTQRHEYPWERDVADESPRIGVFVCQCGRNISSVIDVERVAKEAAKLSHVHHAEANAYTCSDANQKHIKEMFHKHRLNRLVVASCSSRTHEALFQETLRESGLNPYLLAMTNIRDQCSWVHRDDAAAAAAKATELVSMAVARARHLKQLPLYELPVTAEALILGGGLAGMTAAQNLAGQGFKAHLVEREAFLGGSLRNARANTEQADAPIDLQQLIDKIRSNPKISVHVSSELTRISGQVGNFKSVLNEAGMEKTIDHGVVIIATGQRESPVESSSRNVIPRMALKSQAESVPTDHFLLEPHSKLRPLDLSNEGQFVCGLAHSPCSIDEAIAQAQAVAARAAAILSKAQLEIIGQIATVNPAECVACATCVKTCPYGAPAINELRKAEIQSAKCMGCGSCVASCPARAIMLQYQDGEAMTSMLDELLVSGGAL